MYIWYQTITRFRHKSMTVFARAVHTLVKVLPNFIRSGATDICASGLIWFSSEFRFNISHADRNEEFIASGKPMCWCVRHLEGIASFRYVNPIRLNNQSVRDYIIWTVMTYRSNWFNKKYHSDYQCSCNVR